MRRFFFILTLLFSTCQVLAQSELHDGEELFLEKKYNAAIPLYLKAYSKKPTYQAASRLAESYWRLNLLEQAEPWFEKSTKMEEATPELRLYYADMLKQLERYTEAKDQYIYFGDSLYDSLEVKAFISYCDSFPLWLNEPPRHTVYILEGINTIYSEIAPSWMNTQLSFTSDRVSMMSPWKLENEETGTSFYEVYTANVKGNKVENINHLMDSKNNPYHEGPASFSTNGSEVYMTTVVYDKKSAKEVYTLDIFVAEVLGDQWTDRRPFEHNTDEYNEGHACLSSDGQRLYFVSNRPSGYGGADIYVCFKNDTTWTIPVNLGPEVNTAFDEKFPFEYSENELYYASNRPNSMGGLDIYKSIKEDGIWGLGTNMKSPINSPRDDFGILFYPDEQKGFLTSNRMGGEGSDDIYGFNLVPPDSVQTIDSLLAEQELDSIIDELPVRSLRIRDLTVDYDATNDSSSLLKGQVVEVINDYNTSPLAESEVRVINKKSGEEQTTMTDSEGRFQVPRDTNNLFAVQAGKEGYFTSGKNIRINDADSSIKIVGESDIIENIQYNFDDYRLREESLPILDRVATLMKNKPNYAIVVRSYCDTRGDAEYNLGLSEKRAASVKGYLISQGVSASRIFSIGFGESNPLIEFAETEEQHFTNRRTEFDLKIKE